MDGHPPQPRPGGRTARVRRQVVDAVVAQLLEHGLSAVTVDTVAARARVHRATVFRRWRDVGGLLADAFDAAGEDDWQPPDHGTLVDDLTDLNRQVVEYLAPARSLARALLLAAPSSSTAQAALQRFLADRYRRCEVVVVRAVARGELPPNVDARQVLISSTGPMYHLVLHLGEELTAQQCGAYAQRAAGAPPRHPEPPA